MIWKRIPSFEGYEISSEGKVKSNLIKKGLILKPTVRPDGYLSVRLRKEGAYHYKYIHRLVAEAFICLKPIDLNRLVLHKNGKKDDNRVVNLKVTKRNPIAEGVTQSPSGSFVAKINRTYIGSFNTQKEAHEAYQKAKNEKK